MESVVIARRKMQSEILSEAHNPAMATPMVTRLLRLYVRQIVLVFFLIFVSFNFAACFNAPEPTICKQFFDLESTERLNAFGSFDLDDQFQIQTCALNRHAGPDYSYDIAIAGPSLIPYLLDRIRRSKEIRDPWERDKVIMAAVQVFRGLAFNGDLRGRPELIFPIQKAVHEIDTDWLKERAEDCVVVIIRGVNGEPLQTSALTSSAKR